MLTIFHVQHGFHMHGSFLSRGFVLVVVVVSGTVVPFEVVVGMVVASVAFGTLGGFVALFFATWAIVRWFEEALCTDMPIFSTHVTR